MQLTRRFFLRGSGAALGYLGAAPLTQLLQESGVTPEKVKRAKTVVVVFLRGGADGLNLVVPHGDPAYYQLRSWLAVQPPGRPNGAIDLDGFFGLHPAAAPLAPWFRSGTAVALQAVGNAHNTRSHFEEQDVWETGIVGNTIHSDGWLNRHLATSEGHGVVRAVSVGDSLPRILRGDATALSVRGLSDLAFSERPERMAGVVAALEAAYESDKANGAAQQLLASSGKETLEALQVLQELAALEFQPKVEWPNTDLGRRLREVARLVRGDVGLEVVELDLGGWDTHQNQGAIGGPYSQLVGQLAGALAAFLGEMEDRMDDLLVLTLSEFGRTAAQNGTGGTDHGWGNCLLAMGGPVRTASKGQARGVLGEWPGLAREQLQDGRDLRHTTDFRDVFAEVVRGHLGNKNLEKVLPAHEFRPVGLI